jgi:hypothetical protein
MYIPTSFLSTNQLASASIEYLIVGGGGSGGLGYNGGGGAGGLLSGSLILTTYGSYPIQVGAGGTIANALDSGANKNGKPSLAFGLVALGGGSGEGPTDGGSGGGGSFTNGGIGATGTPGQGNNGGNGINPGVITFAGGGGGGASQSGSNYSSSTSASCYNSGNGGNGSQWLDGNYYAGGGGGGVRCGNTIPTGLTNGQGGLGGGGNGYYVLGGLTTGGSAGTANTGGGGGGKGFGTPTSSPAGSGGSGIVKIRYPGGTSRYITGGTITAAAGYTYHTFNSSSVLTLHRNPIRDNLAVGDNFAGGIVVYVTGSYPNQTGFVVPETDPNLSGQWGCNGSSIPGASGTNIGDGKPNTEAMIASCAYTDTAGWLAYNYTGSAGTTDWWLPSPDELYYVCANKQYIPYLYNSSGIYWSSCQISTTQARSRNFSTCNEVNDQKGNSQAIVPIRYFTSSLA